MNERVKEKIKKKYGTLTNFAREIGMSPELFRRKLNGVRRLRESEKILIEMMLEERGIFDEH